MYAVTTTFRDKHNLNHYYKVGDKFETEDKNRIIDLLKRGLITEVKKTKKSKAVE